MGAIGRDPVFVARGQGAEIEDVDGNRYVDWVCSWGPLIAGHAHPAVVEAVTAAARAGTSFGAPTEAEVALAAEVCARIPGAEMVRMVNSGTEATMSAIRLARAATGREKLLKFAGAYHGHVDGLLAEAGSGLATAGMPASPGVPGGAGGGDGDRPLERPRGGRAARWASTRWPPCWPSPTRPTWGLVLPEPGFLAFLREAADANGALLVFDEVISGFRVARGGAQEREGVTPDLTVLGKVIGGGLPAAAYAGPAELMEPGGARGRRLPGRHAVGKPAGHRGGLATLALLDAPAYERLEALADALADGLREAAARAPGCALHVTSTTGLLTPFFRDGPVRDYADAKDCDAAAHAAFCRAMLARGIYLPPSPFEAWFPSLAHTDEHVERDGRARRARRSRRWRRERAGARGRGGGPGSDRARRRQTRPRSVRRAGQRSRPPVRARGGLRGLPAPLRQPAGLRRHGPGPAPARAATRCTRSGCGAWPRSATWTPWPSCRT